MNFNDDLNIFNRFWIDEKFNILVGTNHPNQDFYFKNENFWRIHDSVNLWTILNELGLLAYIQFLNDERLDFKSGYQEYEINDGVRAIKFCVLKN